MYSDDYRCTSKENLFSVVLDGFLIDFYAVVFYTLSVSGRGIHILSLKSIVGGKLHLTLKILRKGR